MIPSDAGEVVAGPREAMLAGLVLVVAIAGALFLFEARWGRPALTHASDQPGGWVGAILVVVASAFVHEALHALAWRVRGRVPQGGTALRRTWRVLGFEAALRHPVPLAVFRAGLSVPALVLGLLPFVVGWASGAGLLVLWALFFLLECFSDLVILFAGRGRPPRTLVRSHPSRLGFEVVAEAAETRG